MSDDEDVSSDETRSSPSSSSGRLGTVSVSVSDAIVSSNNNKLTLYEEMMIERARRRYQDMTPENRKLMERLIVESESKKRSISFRTFQRYQEEIEAHPFKGIFWLSLSGPQGSSPINENEKKKEMDKKDDTGHCKQSMDNPLILYHSSTFENFKTMDYHHQQEMEPVHVASLFRQQISMLLARKISPFGRPPMAHDWPYKASICQVNYFPWALQNHIIEHLAFVAKNDESLIRPSFLKRKRKTENRQKKKVEGDGDDVDDSTSTLKVKKRKFQDNNVYFFDYPCQVRQPTETPEQDDRVKEALPLVCSDSKFVENYYATLMKESLLTYEVQSLQKVLGHHLAELNHIPLLS